MEIEVAFPGGRRVDARFGAFHVATDQSVANGGEGSAPSPFDLFLASIGTCTGHYVASFCRARGLPTEGIRMVLRATRDETTHRVTQIDVGISLPATFPPEYVEACARAAEGCSVKRHLDVPPIISVAAARRDAVPSG